MGSNNISRRREVFHGSIGLSSDSFCRKEKNKYIYIYACVCVCVCVLYNDRRGELNGMFSLENLSEDLVSIFRRDAER